MAKTIIRPALPEFDSEAIDKINALLERIRAMAGVGASAVASSEDLLEEDTCQLLWAIRDASLEAMDAVVVLEDQYREAHKAAEASHG